MKSQSYRSRLLQSRGVTGAKYYGYPLRDLLKKPDPKKRTWTSALPWAAALAVVGGLLIGAMWLFR